MKNTRSTRKPMSRGKKIAIAAGAIGLVAAVPVAYTLLKRRSARVLAKQSVADTKQRVASLVKSSPTAKRVLKAARSAGRNVVKKARV
jgi:hypothetical protein